MNETQIERIRQFMNDKITSNAVFQVLLEAFLRERPTQDVNVLAASRLAIDFLKAGWKEMERLEIKSKTEEDNGFNIGM